MSEPTAPQIVSPLLQRLLADWQARRSGRTLPSRRDFDPLDLKYILGKLLLVDVEREPPGLRFRFRLVGTELTARAGVELTGRTLDDYPSPEYREFMRRRYTQTVEERRPLSSVQASLVIDNRIRRYEALLLPLAADGETVDMLMIGIVYL
jgi:hypothetical protein